MKSRVTITYKNGETETVEYKLLTVKEHWIRIDLSKKTMRSDISQPDGLFIECAKVKEIIVK